MCQEIGCFTSEIEKNTSEIIFFLGFSFNILGQVVSIVADVEPRKVKRYLFSQGADLTFRGSTQVKVVRSCHKNPVATDKTKTEKTP